MYSEEIDQPGYRLILACIHCGFCLQICPTYRALGMEPDSPRGRLYLIRAMAEHKSRMTVDSVEHIYRCVVCRGCETACPSGVKFGYIMDLARAQLIRNHGLPLRSIVTMNVGSNALVTHLSLLKIISTFVRACQKIGLTNLVKHAPETLSRFDFLIPPYSGRVYYPEIPEIVPPMGDKKCRVGFLHGCLMEASFPWTNRAMIRVLAANGCEVVTPREQNCCGAAALHEGMRETAKKLARVNIEAFERAQIDYLVASAAGCAATLEMYGEILKNDPEYSKRAEALSQKVRDVSELLLEIGMNTRLGKLNAVVTYHDSCALAHAQGVTQQPRRILNSIPGVRLVEMKDPDLCCGAGGLNWLTQPDITIETLRMKLKNAAATGASFVVVANLPCYFNFARGVRRFALKMKPVHLVELLDESYKNGGRYSVKAVSDIP
jgi:glycolate oxidase iron-sulfur subunit